MTHAGARLRNRGQSGLSHFAGRFNPGLIDALKRALEFLEA